MSWTFGIRVGAVPLENAFGGIYLSMQSACLGPDTL